ncbi:hypothetical protein C8R43DRAFT_958306 [Mycena crocata]|nr:hypothetical protein C8R43DRAFT_958306 [Mycena crocata]
MAEIYHARGSKLPYALPEACEPLFQSNDPPGSPQLAEIAESLRVAHALKGSLELQLMETRMNLLRLEREDMHVAHHIKRCNQLLAPIRRMPTELLSTIFICYADLMDDTAPARQGPSTVRDGVWSLSHICGHWRDVALSTHALWSRFSFHCSSERLSNAGAFTEEFLRRSGNHLLTIDFFCRESHDETPHLHCRGVLNTLLSRSRQWKVATFYLPRHLYDNMVQGTITDNLPFLETLALRVAFKEAGTLNDLDTFRSCPSLIKLTLSAGVPWRDYIAFPWHQLSSYHGDANYGDIHVLPLASNIRNCSLRFLTFSLPLIHQMRSLKLTGVHPPLGQLTLPALEHLSFVTSTRIHDFSAITALVRTASALSSLEIFFHILEGNLLASMLEFFATLPTVERLHIIELHRGSERQIYSAAVFDGLVQRADAAAPLPLPMLMHLTLTGVAFDIGLVRMVESRCVAPAHGRARLVSLGVTDVGPTDHSLLLRLRQCEHKLGLELTIE